MYLNMKKFLDDNGNFLRLTLTWDVFKYYKEITLEEYELINLNMGCI